MPSPAALLFDRSCTVTIGTVQIESIGRKSGLRTKFQVLRSLKPKEPNTCDLMIWNLSDEHRQAIDSYTTAIKSMSAAPGSKLGGIGAGSTVVPVKIEAGYAGNTSTIFLGNMRSAQTVRDDTDLITELNTGDGDEALILARSSYSFGSGANAYVVAQRLLIDMGCGVGNIATVEVILRGAPLFSGGYVLKGNSAGHLVDLATSCNLEVSVQGGVAQWVSMGQPLGGEAYQLSSDPNTGLVGSPTCDTKGICHAETLLLPGLTPGQSVVVDAKFVKGQFRVVSMVTQGDTFGGDWGHQLELARQGLAP